MDNGFLLDANIFIEPYRRYYCFEICPAYWKSLLIHHESGRVFSIDRVKKELVVEEDTLVKWIDEHVPEKFFWETGTAPEVHRAYGEIGEWVSNHSRFNEDAKRNFLDASIADGWIVAHAMVSQFTVVTHEKYDSATKKSVKIPNLCEQFDVKCCNVFDMLRELKVIMN